MERSAADDKITVLFYFTPGTNAQQHPLSPLGILVPQWSLSPVPCTATLPQAASGPSQPRAHPRARGGQHGMASAPGMAWEGGHGGKWPGGDGPSAPCQPGAVWGWLKGWPFTSDGMATSDVTHRTPAFPRWDFPWISQGDGNQS